MGGWACLPFGRGRHSPAASNRPELFPLRRQVREPRGARAREVRSPIAGGHGDGHLTGPAHLNGRVRPGARLEGHVEMLKAQLAVAEAVGAGDCQAGEGSRRVLGARGRATSALAAAAHGLRLALPGAFPSTTPPRLFDQPSYPLKTPRSQARRSRTSASPRSRPQRSRRWSTATRGQAVVSGETWACGAA